MDRALPILARYEVIREIGRGGMATVFLARQLGLDRLVALKGLIGLRVDEPGLAERFLREARLAGSLNHHRIVTVYDYFEDGGTAFIAMEYLPRGSLRLLVGQLSLAQGLVVLADVLDALVYAERRGVVHRDIKPENMLVTDDGRVKIADFGIAKAVDAVTGMQRLTATGIAVGTPAYMAPEQAMGGEVTAAADRYAVGVTAYELLAGAPPFAADTPMALMLRHLQEPVPPLLETNPDVPPRLAAWVEQLLAKQADQRFASAEEAHAELQDTIDDILGGDARRRQGAALPVTGDSQETGGVPATSPTTGERYETYDQPPPPGHRKRTRPRPLSRRPSPGHLPRRRSSPRRPARATCRADTRAHAACAHHAAAREPATAAAGNGPPVGHRTGTRRIDAGHRPATRPSATSQAAPARDAGCSRARGRDPGGGGVAARRRSAEARSWPRRQVDGDSASIRADLQGCRNAHHRWRSAARRTHDRGHRRPRALRRPRGPACRAVRSRGLARRR